MKEVKGIFFNTGMQGIGAVELVGDFYEISDMLQIVIVEGKNGEPSITFRHLSPFVDEAKVGTDIKVHVSLAFLYPLDQPLVEGYYTTTRKIQPITSGIIIK